MNLRRTIENEVIRYFSDNKEIFRMKEVLGDSSVTISLGGELLSETVHEFQDEALAFVSVSKDIILDMSEVKYISSSYMDALLKIQTKIDETEKGSLCLKNVPEEVYSELKKTGISELLDIE